MASTARRAAQNPNRQRTVYSCNFRSAGRLSNENARALTSIHESFARHLATALDAYLGTGLEVKLTSLDQLPVKDHIAATSPLAYIVPFSLSANPSTVLVECDVNLVFPIVDLLLGGAGMGGTAARELSEIEEEIMQEVIVTIIRQAEATWRMPSMSLGAHRRIKSNLLTQYCPHNEKVTCLKFEVDIAGTIGVFQLIFPTTFLNVLIQQIKSDQPQKRGSVRFFPRPPIRERILDCDVEVAAELENLRVAVRDLVALRPGSVLKLRAPIRTPGTLTTGGHAFFEALPVRNGQQKAAQLGRKLTPASWERM